jgi:ribosome-associated protein
MTFEEFLMRINEPENLLEEEAQPPTKSQLKRESAALQDFGQELVDLSEEQLSRLELPDELRNAVRIAQSITAHGGLRRQIKYIGKLLRNLDAEPIRERLAQLKSDGALTVRQQHQVERWRDRLLIEGDEAINALIAEYSNADRQKLRQLVRDARCEQEQQQAPRSARLLFRYLRDFLIRD